MTIKKQLGQFDTPVGLAKFLYKTAQIEHDYFVDLGAGAGNLSHAIKGAGLQVELDLKRIENIKIKDQVIVLNTDVLDSDFNLTPYTQEHTKVLYVSNPPFSVKKRHEGFCFFKEGGDKKINQTDVYFLDVIMRSIQKNDSLILIISAPFIQSESYLKERIQFFNFFNDVHIFKLAKHTFKGADVQTYAILAKNESSTAQPIALTQINSLLKTLRSETIDRSVLESGVFFSNENIQLATSELCLADINPLIFRGRQRYGGGSPIIKVSDLNNGDLYFQEALEQTEKTAQKGDILVARVGNVIGRCARLKSSQCAISDTVLCLRVEKEFQDRVWSSLQDPKVKLWLRSKAQGKCAKYITYETLLQIPLY